MSQRDPQTTADVEYYTVVYRVEGGRQIKNEWWQGIQPIFLRVDQPISVVSVTRGDLVERVDPLEMATEAVQNV